MKISSKSSKKIVMNRNQTQKDKLIHDQNDNNLNNR